MTPIEQNIWQALVELDDAVKALPAANPGPGLLPIFCRLDELARELPREVSPGLRHYLQKKSYEKARLFLQGRGNENQTGSCAHV